MSFTGIFRNRIREPLARPMLAQGGEQTIVWSADASGVLTRLEEMERYIDQLQSRIDSLEYMAANHGPDLIPGPVDASTFYELASDGTLRAGLNVSVPAGGMFEIALFPEPTVKLATADAIVDEDDPDSNHGSGNYLVASNAASDEFKRALLKVATDSYPDGYWDMPVIALLRLRLYGTPNEQSVYCRCTAEDWAENTITWNNQPSVEDQVLDSEFVDSADTYSYFDVRPFLHRLRRLYDEDNPLDFYGFRIEADENKLEGTVQYYSKEGASTDSDKPQLLYWFAPETSKVAQGGTKENRLYGKPGGVYWFAYRMMDANNNPSAWSMPVKVTLPSQGATPSAPASAPTIEETNMTNVKMIVLTASVPTDFAYYEVHIQRVSPSTMNTYVKTRSDRLLHVFKYEGGDYTSFWVRYRIVTRSGKTSGWSYWTDIMIFHQWCKYHSSNLSYDTAIDVQAGGDIYLGRAAGSSGRTYEMIGGTGYEVLVNRLKDISPHNLVALYVAGSASASEINVTTTYYSNIGNVFTYTPPGSGTARILVGCACTIFKNTASAIRMTFACDLADWPEMCYSGAATAETVFFWEIFNQPAGTQHAWVLRAKIDGSGTGIIYYHRCFAFDLGRT